MAPTEKTKVAYTGRREVDAGLLAEFHHLEDQRVAALLQKRTQPDSLMVAKKK